MIALLTITSSISPAVISLTTSSVISSPALTISFLVFLETIFSAAYLPINRSANKAVLTPSWAEIKIPSFVPQSSALTITSWETSTNLRVKYPALAVLRAESVKPFLEPRAEATYSKIESPCLKFPLIGSSTIFPIGSIIRPLMAESCFSCSFPALAPSESIIILITLPWSRLFQVKVAILSVVPSQMSLESLFFSSIVIKPS